MATPVLIQHVNSSVQQIGYTSGAAKIQLLNDTLAGNTLILGFQGGAPAPTLTITDNSGVAWPNAGAAQVALTTSGNVTLLFYKPNITAGINTITLSAGAGTAQFLQYTVDEFNNLTASPLDVSGSADNAGTTTPSYSITTTTNGDLIWTFGNDYTGDDALGLGNFTAGSGATLLHADKNCGTLSQYQIQATLGAISPGFTATAAHNWALVGIALKTGTAGATPTITPRVVSLFQLSAPPSSTTIAFQVPTQGNLLVGNWVGENHAVPATLASITSISSTPSNTWQQRGNNYGTSADFACGQFWTAENASTSLTMTGTVTISNATSAVYHSSLYLYDIIGAATAPFDTNAETNGTQTVAGNLTTVSITPSTANGIILANVWVDAATVATLNAPSGGHAMNGYYTTSNGNDDQWAETNGFASYQNPNTAARSFIYTIVPAATPTNIWFAGAIALKAPAGGGGPFPPFDPRLNLVRF